MTTNSNLEPYREYLNLLGRMQVNRDLQAKVDVSGVVQVTMMEVDQQVDVWTALDDEARLPWLRKIFANNLLDAIRRFRAQSRDVARERSLEQALENSASRLNLLLVGQESSPSRKAIRNEEALRLTQALAQLTPPQREAIELHHLQGLPLAEVGERMNRDKGAIAALVFRGTRRLRELLSQ